MFKGTFPARRKILGEDAKQRDVVRRRCGLERIPGTRERCGVPHSV